MLIAQSVSLTISIVSHSVSLKVEWIFVSDLPFVRRLLLQHFVGCLLCGLRRLQQSTLLLLLSLLRTRTLLSLLLQHFLGCLLCGWRQQSILLLSLLLSLLGTRTLLLSLLLLTLLRTRTLLLLTL